MTRAGNQSSHEFAKVIPLPSSAGQGDDHQLVRRAKERDEAALAILFDRFISHVNRMVWHLTGTDQDHDDLVNEIFLNIWNGIGRLREPEKLHGWVLGVTVNTVRAELRRRSTARRLTTNAVAVEETPSSGVDYEARDLLDRTFVLLAQLAADLRIAFVLRYLESRPLEEVATLCDWSLATTKRRLAKADRRFIALAKKDPELCARLEQGGRWVERNDDAT